MIELIDIFGTLFKALLSTTNQAFIVCELFLLASVGVLSFYLWKQGKKIIELETNLKDIVGILKDKKDELLDHQKNLQDINRLIEGLEDENKKLYAKVKSINEKIKNRE